jgi:hypothetical protein
MALILAARTSISSYCQASGKTIHLASNTKPPIKRVRAKGKDLEWILTVSGSKRHFLLG